MNNLFYSLIHNTRTKRWFLLLEALEESLVITAHELAVETGCSTRTVHNDMKEMKEYFKRSIQLIGNDEGYHFSYQNPRLYRIQKQYLLEEEPLFMYIDHILENRRKVNQEWATKLKLSTASFGRIKRAMNTYLERDYQVTLGKRDNRLLGKESAIRQLMFDYYFGISLLPKEIEQKMPKDFLARKIQSSGEWKLDPLLLNQWLYVAERRIAAGYGLPETISSKDTEQKLAHALDQVILLPLSSNEKSALFLLSLKENQFINLLTQKEFVRIFSPVIKRSYLVRNFESITIQFFDTLIYLMKNFFQLPINNIAIEGLANNQSQEEVFLKQLMERYLKIKKEVEKPLIVSFELVGTFALQRWLKETVCSHLRASGYYLLEPGGAHSNFPAIYQLKVTNRKQTRKTCSWVVLSSSPDKQEIVQECECFIKTLKTKFKEEGENAPF